METNFEESLDVSFVGKCVEEMELNTEVRKVEHHLDYQHERGVEADDPPEFLLGPNFLNKSEAECHYRIERTDQTCILVHAKNHRNVDQVLSLRDPNVKEGFNNPFLLNLAKWHKVKIQDNTPRVTLRLMAEKDIPFSTWEKMVDNGTFLK